MIRIVFSSWASIFEPNYPDHLYSNKESKLIITPLTTINIPHLPIIPFNLKKTQLTTIVFLVLSSARTTLLLSSPSSFFPSSSTAYSRSHRMERSSGVKRRGGEEQEDGMRARRQSDKRTRRWSLQMGKGFLENNLEIFISERSELKQKRMINDE